MASWFSWVSGEPVMIQAVLISGIDLAADFGLHMSQDQQTELVVFLMLLFGLVTRQVTTPNAKIAAPGAPPAPPSPPAP